MLRKSQPNFQHYIIKIEAQTKKQFSYKKRVEQKTLFNQPFLNQCSVPISPENIRNLEILEVEY